MLPQKITGDQLQTASLLQECVMVRDGLANLCDCFTAGDMSDIASYLSTCWFSVSVSLSVCLLYLYFVYDFDNNNDNLRDAAEILQDSRSTATAIGTLMSYLFNCTTGQVVQMWEILHLRAKLDNAVIKSDLSPLQQFM